MTIDTDRSVSMTVFFFLYTYKSVFHITVGPVVALNKCVGKTQSCSVVAKPYDRLQREKIYVNVLLCVHGNSMTNRAIIMINTESSYAIGQLRTKKFVAIFLKIEKCANVKSNF